MRSICNQSSGKNACPVVRGSMNTTPLGLGDYFRQRIAQAVGPAAPHDPPAPPMG